MLISDLYSDVVIDVDQDLCLEAPRGQKQSVGLALGDRSFPVAASRAWNGLPASARVATSLVSFRKELKMVLFQSSFE